MFNCRERVLEVVQQYPPLLGLDAPCSIPRATRCGSAAFTFQAVHTVADGVGGPDRLGVSCGAGFVPRLMELAPGYVWCDCADLCSPSPPPCLFWVPIVDVRDCLRFDGE